MSVFDSSADVVRIYVGTDRSQMLGVRVLEYSIGKHTRQPFEVHPLLLSLPEPRNKMNTQRTGFSFSRFAIPKLAGYQGKAIYMDADMLVFADIKELWDLPFEGAKMLIQEDLPQHAINSHTKKKRRKQTSVSLLDCGALDWNVNDIIAGLDGKYSYDELMNELCILDESEIGYRIPFRWNSLEHWDSTTCNLHYTDMNTQPWVSPSNKLGYLWLDVLREMLAKGVLSWAELQKEVELGYARPSLLHELAAADELKPIDEKQIAILEEIDRKAKFKKHKEASDAEKRRKLAVLKYRLADAGLRPRLAMSGMRRAFLGSRATQLVASRIQTFLGGKQSASLHAKLLHPTNAGDSTKRSILIVLDLIQDLEVMKPLIKGLQDHGQVTLKVLVSSWLKRNSSRVLDYLQAEGVDFHVFHSSLLTGDAHLPFLDGFDCVLLPSESNLPPHRTSHHIATAARSRGLKTVTFQHGLENIGLTYFDDKTVDIASSAIVTWSDAPQREPRISPHIRDKCVSLGMFKDMTGAIDSGELRNMLGFSNIVGVFENLHWERYSEAYRQEFLNALEATAKRRENVAFLVKPHHAGRWLSRHQAKALKRLKNVKVIDVRDSFWERYTGNQLVQACDLVITSPSTIAVDAALASKPVAIVANDLRDLTYYAPLVLLHSCEDWTAYMDRTLGNPQSDIDKVEAFLKRSVRQLNPVDDFIEHVIELAEPAKVV